MQMLNELHWESLESLRDQSRLIMLYNILKQNIYHPSKYTPEFHSQISQYQLQTRSCHMLCLAETLIFVIPTFTSTLLCHHRPDYGTLCHAT